MSASLWYTIVSCVLTNHLSQAVKLWFQNFARKRGKIGRAKYIKKKNWYNVAASTYRQDIKDIMAKKDPGLDTKSPDYLGTFQQYLKELTDDLPSDKIQDLKNMAETWNESGPPDEVKKR